MSRAPSCLRSAGGRSSRASPSSEEIADVECEDFSRLPGPHVTPEQMWRLARRAAAWLERPDVDGLVVTHGTDTLEETAFFLHLVLTSDKPVVLLGAMHPSSDPDWDGPANLRAALRVAASPGARARGALIVMAGTILSAAEARKLHSAKPAAFGAPGKGPVGIVENGHVRFLRSGTARPAWEAAGAEAGMRVPRIDARVDLDIGRRGRRRSLRALRADERRAWPDHRGVRQRQRAARPSCRHPRRPGGRRSGSRRDAGRRGRGQPAVRIRGRRARSPLAGRDDGGSAVRSESPGASDGGARRGRCDFRRARRRGSDRSWRCRRWRAGLPAKRPPNPRKRSRPRARCRSDRNRAAPASSCRRYLRAGRRRYPADGSRPCSQSVPA